MDREMELRGAQTNAATWVDWTYYHQTLAARGDNLRTVMTFEADRLANLRFDRETFDSELEVVRNERRMSVDDSALGALGEAVYATAFECHPYRTPTIGKGEHLEATTLEQVREFYRAHYAPDQTVVVIAGDIDPQETLNLVVEHYGTLSPSGQKLPSLPPEPVQREERRVEIARPVNVPYVNVAYHIPGQLDPSFPSLEVASEVLFVGDNARLYRRLVTEERLASDVEGYLTPFAEPGLCEVFVTLREEVHLERAVEIVQEELERLPETLTIEELEKAKNGLELAYYEDLRDADGMAEALGHFEVAHNDYRRAFDGAARFQAVSQDSVSAICRSVFQVKNRTIGVLRPTDSSPENASDGDQ
ncbi:MAG: pitrilysin family protein [Myxococcota bacterium]